MSRKITQRKATTEERKNKKSKNFYGLKRYPKLNPKSSFLIVFPIPGRKFLKLREFKKVPLIKPNFKPIKRPSSKELIN